MTDISRFEQIREDSPYGNHVSYTRGMGVKRPDIEAGRGRHERDWNAILIDPSGSSVKLWVSDFETSFALSGEFGQSRHTRQFFPRNFTQPTVTIKGRMPNNYQYNRLAAFIRHSHAVALGIDHRVQADQAAGNGDRTTYSPITGPLLQFSLRGGGRNAKRHQRGKHKHQSLTGYVKNISAGGERFNNAPEFQFDFVVAFSQFSGTVGLYEDTRATGNLIKSWMDIFKTFEFQGQLDQQNNITNTTTVVNAVEEIVGTVADIFH